jgi:hypothetical protein
LISISRNRAIWQTQLQGEFSIMSFSEFSPSSFAGTREVEDYRSNKSRFFLGLGLAASGRRGLSIEEVDDCNKCPRAQSKGVWRGWQMQYGGEFYKRW